MTREEAMDELKFLKKTLLRTKEIEALDIAIKALQEYEKYFPTPTEDCH